MYLEQAKDEVSLEPLSVMALVKVQEHMVHIMCVHLVLLVLVHIQDVFSQAKKCQASTPRMPK